MGSGRIVVGLHPVRELLRAGRPIDRIRVAEERSGSSVVTEIRALAERAGVAIDDVSRRELDDAAAGLVHQGVVADAPAFVTSSIDEVLAGVPQGVPGLFVALDGVTDPHNVGSIARSAEAVGAHGLILPQRRSASVTPTVEKAAAGALAHLPVASVTNLVRSLSRLSDDGVWSIGLDADADTRLEDCTLTAEPCALVVGGEGRGLSRLVRERCDVLTRLEMRGRVASLNASVAAAVALYLVASRR